MTFRAGPVLAAGLAVLMASGPAGAQTSRVPPADQGRMMLDAAKDQWIAFRNFHGRQWIYFTIIQVHHCNLEEIRYSIDSTELDQRFPIAPCVEQDPFAVSELKHIAIDLPPGSARSLAVQVLWKDGVESAINVYVPCDVPGDSTCGARKP